MDFYAEELPNTPEIAYIAIVGPLQPGFTGEIVSRTQRIQEASPSKNTLVLDVRGLTGLEADHFDLLKELQEQLNARDWNLIFCNIPARFQDFFDSGRVQRTFDVYSQKSDLLESLQDEPDETEETNRKPRRVPVVIRTESGVRLFEGTASNLEGSSLTVWTSDRNAETINGNSSLDLTLYFDTSRIQVVPMGISLEDLEEVDHDEWNYRLEVEFKEVDELEMQQIKEYFQSGVKTDQPPA